MLRCHGLGAAGLTAKIRTGRPLLPLTFIARASCDLPTAPWRVDQATPLRNTCSQLRPTLKAGDSVICDSLPILKVAEIQGIVEAQGITLKYLPPYSPDLNPIESAFAKLKTYLRKTAERTYDKLWQTTGQLLDQFPANECLNLFKNSGYVYS